MVGMAAMMLPSFDGAALDRVVPVVAALQLPPPVLVAPPSAASAQWTARSDTQNRPQRVSLTLDGASGQIVKRIDFNQRPMLDRLIGTGVAAPDGPLFSCVKQVPGVLTAHGLITLRHSRLLDRKGGGRGMSSTER